MTAPLRARLSIPPLAIDATRRSTSRGTPAESLAAMNCSAIAARAIDGLLDADPIRPSAGAAQSSFRRNCRDDFLDLRPALHGIHGEGDGAERDRCCGLPFHPCFTRPFKS
jgi:hypothetical protein